ncbi:MAG TPA: helicase HerA-like domain-containing protein [Solirubrobacteraceae bacterium]|jgi:DNA helicase HerA-like ATPase|nr:helicase HerA-like domain-containing protein [Solirubrobacteraceae bacterium]
MIEDPPPPPFLRTRNLLWPALGFAGLLLMPAWVALAVASAAVTARIVWRDIRHVRARDAAIAARAAQGAALPLGTDRSGKTVLVPEEALAAHGLILGATGAGKSTTLLTLLSEQISRGRPVVAIDLKGSPGFATELRAAAGAAARPFVQWTPDGGAHWNPLAVGNATELKDKLLGTERFTEPHYRRAAERYLQLAIQVAQAGTEQQPLTLARVVELLAPERLAVAVRALPRARREYVRDYLTSLTPDQQSAVRGLASRLAVLTESETGRYMEPGPDAPTVDLRRALGGGEVVLFSLNSSTYGGLAGMLGTLAVQDLVAAAGARLSAGRGAPGGAVVGIDEFSALGSDNVMALLARGREAGIGVLLATQELADLDRAGRGLRDQVLGNTAVKIAHRQDVPESAETVARLAGTIRVWERSYQARPSAGGLGSNVATSARLVERYAVEPEQVRTLPTGEALVIVKAPRASAQLTRIRRQPPAPGVTR